MIITNEVKKNEDIVMFSPGQGQPYLGMGNNVFNTSLRTKAVWDCASEISGFDVGKLCMKGPMTKLVQTRYQQLAVTTINIATLLLLRERFLFNEIGYSGHSAGEYSALFAANVFDLEKLFKIINYRSLIMQELASNKKGVMYIVKNYPYNKIRTLIHTNGLKGLVNICCDNNEHQQVIGGDITSVRIIINQLFKMKIETTKLAVNGAWHTDLMLDAKERMEFFLANIDFSPPLQPIIMNVQPKFVSNTKTIKANLVNQLTDTVRWRETMATWNKKGYKNYIEISGKKSLYYIAKNFYPENGITILHSNDYI
ncbi:ACP S-malonyltransferase [Providencia burhodogranariea]|uniref:Malonyl CoA-acyl carrier protein transacylase n=1 Tax=Providencia burhodogranariea DSM 19968 TaxID=1141662 RepID=K8WQV3_9GAMM|nr:ACP S-malonyltransferase [Providencia burhodogranariea]EKT62331.1 transacylase [Providencia burhodogranariea DSM 19968]